MKRKAEDDVVLCSPKRLAISTAEPSSNLDIDTFLLQSPLNLDSPTTPTALNTPSSPTDAASTIAFSTQSTRSTKLFPSDLKTIPCTYPSCPKTFNRPARLAAHLRSHTQDRPFKCRYDGCDKDYTEAKHLKQHVLGTHTQNRQYMCEVEGCGKGFTTGTRLRRHAAVHEGAERYRCREYPPCEMTFRKRATLERHVLTEHKGEKAFPCVEKGCGEGCDTANALKRHVEREHGELRYWCEECLANEDGVVDEGMRDRAGFTTRALLEAHMRHEHVNCMFCDGLRFGSQFELDQHFEVHHSGKSIEARKTIECSKKECEKKFTKRSNMLAHFRNVHEGVSYICGQYDVSSISPLQDWDRRTDGCGETFISKDSLVKHTTHVHLGKPRSAVAVADQGSSFLDHSWTVDRISGAQTERQNKFSCHHILCGRTFRRHAHLQKHLLQDHASDVGLEAALPRVVHSAVGEPDWSSTQEGFSAYDWTALDGNVLGGDAWLQDEQDLHKLINFEATVDPTLAA